MLLSPEELAARFRREIDRRGTDDKFIDLDEERELVLIAVAYGYEPQKARDTLAGVCGERGYVRERELRDRVREALAARGDSPLRRRDFARLVAALSGRPAADLRKLVAQEVADAGVPVRSRWPFNWWGSMQKAK
jgi:hypothetical protein